MLSYFWASGRLHLVHVPSAAPPRLHQVPGGIDIPELAARAAADAAVLAHAPHGPLAAAVQSSLLDTLAQLDDAILPGELEDLPVVIVPSGKLARLPWGMLPRLRHRSLTLSRSVASWRGNATRKSGTVAVGVATGPDLFLAENEAQRVAACWPGAIRVPGSPAEVRSALASHDVVHIAAHGEHRADNPLFSSVRLQGGSLFAHELEGLDVKASLVVLSACGSGRSRLRPGDEALGLTSSLLALGVRAVVAPLTDVPDDVACETMAGLHAGLAAGHDGPEALAKASPSLLARSFSWFGSPWSRD
nr:CHAT domain-containing protein [Tessaracoccus sp. OS52]